MVGITFSPTDGHAEFTDGTAGDHDRPIPSGTKRSSSITTGAIREIKSDRKVELGLWAIILGLITLRWNCAHDNIIFLAIVMALRASATQAEIGSSR
jgi:hypothetical protein